MTTLCSGLCYRKSVCRLSVLCTFVRPTQGVALTSGISLVSGYTAACYTVPTAVLAHDDRSHSVDWTSMKKFHLHFSRTHSLCPALTSLQIYVYYSEAMVLLPTSSLQSKSPSMNQSQYFHTFLIYGQRYRYSDAGGTMFSGCPLVRHRLF